MEWYLQKLTEGEIQELCGKDIEENIPIEANYCRFMYGPLQSLVKFVAPQVLSHQGDSDLARGIVPNFPIP